MSHPDFLAVHHGSIITLKPMNSDAREWVDEHITGDEVPWFGGAVVIEPRYFGDIAHAIEAHGLSITH